MLLPLFAIPALGAFIGIGTVYSLYTYATLTLTSPSHVKIISEELLDNLNVEGLLKNEISKIDWEANISPLLHKKMERLFELFKQQIPMASMVITPQLTAKLTDLATPELLKLVPELQDMLMNKVNAETIKEKISEKLSSIDSVVLHKIAAPLLQKSYIFASLLGFIIGCIQLVIAVYIK